MTATWKKFAYYGEAAVSFVGLTDTPADYETNGLKLLRVNVEEEGIEFVAVTDYLEGAPTEDEAGKAPTSEWAFDHVANASAHHVKYTDGEAVSAVKAGVALNELQVPLGAVAFNGQQAQNLIIHSVADATARPTAVVGKIIHQQDDDCIYVCTDVGE